MNKEEIKKEAWQVWEEDQKANPQAVNPYAFVYGYLCCALNRNKMSPNAKNQEEILDMWAKDKMVEWGLDGFKKSYPSLFAVIMQSMSTFSQQQAIGFEEWLNKSTYTRSIAEKTKDLWYDVKGSPLGEKSHFTTAEMFNLYLKSSK